MKKTQPLVPAAVPIPGAGGSYLYDPEAGTLTLVVEPDPSLKTPDHGKALPQEDSSSQD